MLYSYRMIYWTLWREIIPHLNTLLMQLDTPRTMRWAFFHSLIVSGDLFDSFPAYALHFRFWKDPLLIRHRPQVLSVADHFPHLEESWKHSNMASPSAPSRIKLYEVDPRLSRQDQVELEAVNLVEEVDSNPATSSDVNDLVEDNSTDKYDEKPRSARGRSINRCESNLTWYKNRSATLIVSPRGVDARKLTTLECLSAQRSHALHKEQFTEWILQKEKEWVDFVLLNSKKYWV